MVTNNLEIKKYDFYLPNNIFIFNDDKIEDLQTFLTTEYFPLEESIYKKYAFTNWINNIVESQNKISIHLP